MDTGSGQNRGMDHALESLEIPPYDERVNLSELFIAIDAKPFKPFVIEIVSGRRIPVTHPDNIFVLPNRNTVSNIQVYGPDGHAQALIWPEGLAGIFFNGDGNGHDSA